jgi:hypothetical protein
MNSLDYPIICFANSGNEAFVLPLRARFIADIFNIATM